MGHTEHSEYYSSPESYFESYESKIESFEDLNNKLNDLVKNNPSIDFVWRGQSDSSWGLKSSLYRALDPGNDGNLNEDKLNAAEKSILKSARKNWRMYNKSALEIFAAIQHHGGVTRLLDVTLNPYIATWFAVESNMDKDSRLFALSKHPERSDSKDILNLEINSEHLNSYMPFWHSWDKSESKTNNWGTGNGWRIWVPPTYNSRILAQNAAFLIDGVPIALESTAPYYKVKGAGHNKNWKIRDIRSSSSIHVRLYNPDESESDRQKGRRKKTVTPRKFPPTFNFRITKDAKPEIKKMLEKTFGYTNSLIYPDILGLSEYTKLNILS